VRRHLAVALAALIAASFTAPVAASAASTTPSPPFTQCPAVGADTSCALLIHIDSQSRTGVYGDPTQGPYDGVEDTLIGVQNDSSVPIASVPVSATSGKDLFGFDGDGLCAYAVAGCPFGPSGYEGPGVSFTSISSDNTAGTVNFSPPIPPGGHSFFSLEEALATVPPFDLNPGPPVPAGRRYVALGDSFSAGEGNPPFQSPTASDTDVCHRSDSGYPQLLDNDLSLNITQFEFAACSGATRHDVSFGGFNTESAQLSHLDHSTRLVTISVGGNDIDFPDVLPQCATGISPALFGKVASSADCQNLPAVNPDTGAKTTLDGREKQLITDLATDSPALCFTPGGYLACSRRLAGLYYDIAQSSAPDVQIVVLLYPHLFTTAPPNGGVEVGSRTKFSKKNVEWINTGTDRLDARIIEEIKVAQAAGANVTWADPRPVFDDNAAGASPGGHGIGSNQPWVYGIKLRGTSPRPYSFHPNTQGQQAFARVVKAKITTP
jgi:lysophospholipase L1-like esterase